MSENLGLLRYLFFRRSSRLDVATVQLVNSTDNECAFTADISAVSKSSLRKTSIIIAENKGTVKYKICRPPKNLQ